MATKTDNVEVTCIIVLGPPRSGTSAVAGVCYHLGVNMGKQFLDGEARFRNPTGIFEDIDFVWLHLALAHGYAQRVSDIPYLSLQSLCANMGKGWSAAYTSAVHKRRAQPLWGIKEPIMCFALPHFLRLLNSPSRIIAVQRSLDATIHSMMKSHDAPAQNAQVTIESYLTSRAEVLSDYDGPVLNVQYESLTASPQIEVQRIADFIGVPATCAAVDFIDPLLDHEGAREYA